METFEHDCESCPVADTVGRRDFFRDAAAHALAALGLLAGGATAAHALSVTFVRGSGTRADKSYPIPASDGVAIDRDESVIIARAGDKAFAFSLACPHQNTALRWDKGHNRFQCPKHKSRYTAEGVFIDGRATRGLDRFALRRDANNLLVNLDRLYREDENPKEWAAAFVPLSTVEK